MHLDRKCKVSNVDTRKLHKNTHQMIPNLIHDYHYVDVHFTSFYFYLV